MPSLFHFDSLSLHTGESSRSKGKVISICSTSNWFCVVCTGLLNFLHSRGGKRGFARQNAFFRRTRGLIFYLCLKVSYLCRKIQPWLRWSIYERIKNAEKLLLHLRKYRLDFIFPSCSTVKDLFICSVVVDMFCDGCPKWLISNHRVSKIHSNAFKHGLNSSL